MDQISLSSAIVAALGATIFTLLLITLTHRRWHLPDSTAPSPVIPAENEIVFLFDGPNLLDATTNAQAILRASDTPNPSRADIARLLNSRFPGLQQSLMDPSDSCKRIASATGPDSTARIEPAGDGVRLTLTDTHTLQQAVHPTTLQVMEDEISVLRGIGQHAPQLIWRLNATGTVVWANSAYIAVADHVRSLPLGNSSDWPPPALFEEHLDLEAVTEKITQRHKLRLSDQEEERWFDVTSAPVPDGTLHFAVDAQTTVAAEQQARVFVQTLSKTFAQLSAGLAIFDKSRKLVMFNPALMDLTKLSATFLSAQPDLSTLLDRLRDAGMLPEPKDYLSWRDQVAALETMAEQGTYRDTWSLPGGETYKVSGRPHPDGALAFLIEDITAEISLTRMFRAELETTHAVIDSMEEAIAVFSAAGTLIINNATYNDLWGNKSGDLTGSNLLRELESWKKSAAPTPFWDKLRCFGAPSSDRVEMCDTIQLHDGRSFACRVVPMVSGTTLVGFKSKTPVHTTPAKPAHDLPTVRLRTQSRPV